MDHSPLNDALVLMALSIILVWTLKRFKLTPILGYLFVGVLVGPNAMGWFTEVDSIQLLAEIGVVFLLFMIGLEFSISRLIAMRHTVFGLGSIQVIISTVSGMLIAVMTGIEWKAAFVVGGALALSSTAIVAKQLSDQLEMQGRHGQLAISILLFQDLAVVPILVIIPILASNTDQAIAFPIVMALGKGLLAFVILFYFGRKLLRPYYHLVASTHSSEIFTLATLFIALAAAWLTHELNLSLALGAFLAGLMLSETEYKHQIQSDIRPFRDVLMGLFFISVGAQLDIFVVFDEWIWIGLLTAGLIIGKGSVIILLTKLFGYEMPVAFRTGLVLGQAGEFGFAILVLALSNQLLNLEETQPIIAAALISMIISPVLIRYNSTLANKLFNKTYKSGANVPPKEIEQACKSIRQHVVICGFGRIGQNLANILREMNIQYVALDLDHSIIREAWEAGEQVYYGDSTENDVLEKAEVMRANALIITFDDPTIAEGVITATRSLNKSIPIIVRSRDERHMDILHDKGASNVVPESFEASMMLAIHLLQQLGISNDKAMAFVDKARKDDYKKMRGYFRGEEDFDMDATETLRLHNISLIQDSFAIGKTLAEMELEKSECQLIAVRRGVNRLEKIESDFIFEVGDTIVVEGRPGSLNTMEKNLLEGIN
ncbi:MAG: monovalent cation:proton antiporter-2 (CPA2) family protein [Pseudomonadota bacterium]